MAVGLEHSLPRVPAKGQPENSTPSPLQASGDAIMPVLHKYKNRNGYYVVTAVNQSVVTFQLTYDGQQRLLDAGVTLVQPFHRSLLLELFRSGDAYTRSEADDEKPQLQVEQLEIDFEDDPDPESLFPRCSMCPGMDDLCFVTGRSNEDPAILLCAHCRQSARPNLSIPIEILDRAHFRRLINTRRIKELDPSVQRLQDLFDANFEDRWDSLRKSRAATQSGLDFGGGDELPLID
jgi:hypothetical protein